MKRRLLFIVLSLAYICTTMSMEQEIRYIPLTYGTHESTEESPFGNNELLCFPNADLSDDEKFDYKNLPKDFVDEASSHVKIDEKIQVILSKMHNKKPRKKKYIQCPECKKYLVGGQSDLINHVRIHTKERPFLCDDCGLAFAKTSTLYRHFKTHVGKFFTCDTCSETFENKRDLNHHLRSHQINKSFICQECKKVYKRKDALNNHMRIHTGENFICQKCGLSFFDKSNFNRHSKIHTGEKPFKCEHCTSSFLRKYNYSRHLEIHQ